jgi:hypothetical protein
MEQGRKRKSQGEIRVEKRLKKIEDKQDALVFAFGKFFQVVLRTHQLLEETSKALPIMNAEEDDSTTKRYVISSMFTKRASKTGLTRAHLYVELLCVNMYPTDVEMCDKFIQKRETFEAKEVRKWWNLHRHKIVK